MIKITNICLLFLVFSCAYQGAPKGGPEDIEGPELLSVSPVDQSQLAGNDKIIISFNERINPNSIINSISIKPDLDIVTKVRKNKIIISPVSFWPENELIRVNLNRNITDFHSNYIDDNIQLLYNLNNQEYCVVNGNLENYKKDLVYNIFLYGWPIDTSLEPLQIINTNDEHSFKMNYLEYGKYILIASEGNLDIHNNRYGINTVDYIELDENNCNENISIYIDEPLEKIKIEKIENISSNLINIFYNDGSSELRSVNFTKSGDSTYLDIKKQNRLYEYNIDSYLYIFKEKIDTIPPSIIEVNDVDSEIIVKFSEPINYESLLVMGNKNEEWIELDYELLSLSNLKIKNNAIAKIKFLGDNIQDLSGNNMLDSVKVYDVNNIVDDKGLSILTGKIIGKIPEDTIVEAKNISLNLYYRCETKDSLFIFDNLQPGKYVFRAYEKKNKIDPLIYYSGLLNPYNRSAKFSVYKDTVEVRKFWDIEGINLEF